MGVASPGLMWCEMRGSNKFMSTTSKKNEVELHRDEVVDVLRRARADLEKRGIAHVSLFGSIARGENHDMSDIDLAVILRGDVQVTGFGIVALEMYLGELLGQPVDLVEEPAGRASLQERIELDRVRAF